MNIALFESLMIFLTEVKIKLKTKFIFLYIFNFSIVLETLHAFNTYLIHPITTY